MLIRNLLIILVLRMIGVKNGLEKDHKSGVHQRIPEVNFAKVLMDVCIGGHWLFSCPR